GLLSTLEHPHAVAYGPSGAILVSTNYWVVVPVGAGVLGEPRALADLDHPGPGWFSRISGAAGEDTCVTLQPRSGVLASRPKCRTRQCQGQLELCRDGGRPREPGRTTNGRQPRHRNCARLAHGP